MSNLPPGTTDADIESAYPDPETSLCAYCGGDIQPGLDIPADGLCGPCYRYLNAGRPRYTTPGELADALVDSGRMTRSAADLFAGRTTP